MNNNKLTTEEIIYINSILLNDEVSTDEEIIKLFINELKINEKFSKQIVNLRNKSLIDINFNIKDYLKNE